MVSLFSDHCQLLYTVIIVNYYSQRKPYRLFKTWLLGKQEIEMFSSFCFVGVSAYSIVLIVHCSLTNHLKLHDLKLTVSNSLCRSSIQKGIGVSIESEVNWGCSHLKACLGLAESLPTCFTLKTTKLVPLHVDYSGVFMTWSWLVPE